MNLLCMMIINFYDYSGNVYVGGAHDLWVLTTAPNLKQNIQQLVKEKQYEMAIQLAVCDGSFFYRFSYDIHFEWN